MSHTLGVKCLACEGVLVPDGPCSEGCAEGHGFTWMPPTSYSIAKWPEHSCFKQLPEGWRWAKCPTPGCLKIVGQPASIATVVYECSDHRVRLVLA